MPIFIELSNLVIDKQAVERKYKGGLEQFRKDYQIEEENRSQEDNELFSLSAMNSSEFDLSDLLVGGLDYDGENNFSEDFVLINRYEDEPSWDTSWLQYNSTFAWHRNCAAAKIQKAQGISNMTMDKIEEAFDRGEKPWDTII